MTAGIRSVEDNKEISVASCPVCRLAAGVSYQFCRNDDYRIHRCRDCDVEFVFPQPSDEVLSSIYTESYFIGSEDEKTAQMVADIKRATANLYLDVVTRVMNGQTSRLLEIGCGSGDFLIEASRRGFTVEGIEYSEHAAAVANSRLGEKPVVVGTPDTVEISPATYDIVAAFDVIEHLRDPKTSIEKFRLVLKPGGLIAIVTPSLDSWSRQLLGRHWMEYKREHITYFSERSLRRLLESAGFSSIEFVPNYKVLTYDYIARHFDHFPVPVLSTITHAVRRAIPEALANRKWELVASGMMAIARKAPK